MTYLNPNQRRFPRIRSEHAVILRPLDGEADEALARTGVVGLGGCMVVTDDPVPAGRLLELMVSVKGTVVRADGRVVYCRERDDGRWEAGIEFLRIPDEDLKTIAALFET